MINKIAKIAYRAADSMSMAAMDVYVLAMSGDTFAFMRFL
jgi:hypothetical protein